MDPTPSANPTIVRNTDEVVAVVREAIAQRRPVIDYGVAHTGLGHPPPPNHLGLQPEGGIIEHYQRDLTVRVDAGLAFGQLQQELKATGQFVPLDADSDMTVGEVVVHNVWGGLRPAYGGPRDLLLGLRFVDGQANAVTVGGRTVKNVAGLDITRLMVGSLGELGVLTEVTLRTYAIPDCLMAVDLSVEHPTELDRAMTCWLSSEATPARLVLSNEDGRWLARVAFVGQHAGCSTQVRALEMFIARMRGVHVAGSGTHQLADYLHQRETHRAWRRQVSAVVRLVVSPAETGTFCDLLTAWDERHKVLNIGALPAHGCIVAGGDMDADAALTLDQTILRAMATVGGYREWHRRPGDDPRLAPFAPMPSDLSMQVQLKRTLDPQQLLNPGRFLPLTENGGGA